ncbi:hypothetical protein ALC53_08203 [Atta colombica]|uniref:Uncharacterized protein n=1 Tax=Atta colombica TaxID=520822 RepID=A0A195BB38_9HYME|nr:hypothetical protein ALC53_08203 [Atta colombica]
MSRLCEHFGTQLNRHAEMSLLRWSHHVENLPTRLVGKVEALEQVPLTDILLNIDQKVIELVSRYKFTKIIYKERVNGLNKDCSIILATFFRNNSMDVEVNFFEELITMLKRVLTLPSIKFDEPLSTILQNAQDLQLLLKYLPYIDSDPRYLSLKILFKNKQKLFTYLSSTFSLANVHMPKMEKLLLILQTVGLKNTEPKLPETLKFAIDNINQDKILDSYAYTNVGDWNISISGTPENVLARALTYPIYYISSNANLADFVKQAENMLEERNLINTKILKKQTLETMKYLPSNTYIHEACESVLRKANLMKLVPKLNFTALETATARDTLILRSAIVARRLPLEKLLTPIGLNINHLFNVNTLSHLTKFNDNEIVYFNPIKKSINFHKKDFTSIKIFSIKKTGEIFKYIKHKDTDWNYIFYFGTIFFTAKKLHHLLMLIENEIENENVYKSMKLRHYLELLLLRITLDSVENDKLKTTFDKIIREIPFKQYERQIGQLKFQMMTRKVILALPLNFLIEYKTKKLRMLAVLNELSKSNVFQSSLSSINFAKRIVSKILMVNDLATLIPYLPIYFNLSSIEWKMKIVKILHYCKMTNPLNQTSRTFKQRFRSVNRETSRNCKTTRQLQKRHLLLSILWITRNPYRKKYIYTQERITTLYNCFKACSVRLYTLDHARNIAALIEDVYRAFPYESVFSMLRVEMREFISRPELIKSKLLINDMEVFLHDYFMISLEYRAESDYLNCTLHNEIKIEPATLKLPKDPFEHVTYLGFIKITLRPGFVSLPRERKQWWRWIESSETKGRGVVGHIVRMLRVVYVLVSSRCEK